MTTVVADAGYSSGENYEQLEKRGLTGYIPAHGKYKAEHPGFTYDARAYASKILHFLSSS